MSSPDGRLIVLLAALVMAGVTAASVRADSSAQGAEPRSIEVIARRFAFEPAVVDVTLGERVRLVVRSADGLHGVEIKQFKVKMEVPRGGAPVVIEFTADAVGRFPILCSEYCGEDHESMRGTLVVQAR